jgi:hypothetical protein
MEIGAQVKSVEDELARVSGQESMGELLDWA